MVYEKERQVAIAAVTKAAKLCVKVQTDRAGAAIEKPDRSPVTIADLGAQAVICQAISAAFPNDAIVGEEDSTLLRQPAMVQSLQQVTTVVREIVPDATPENVMNWIDRGNGEVGSRYWTLDPIDGTKGFLRNAQYAIALALVEAGEVKLGVLGCPALPVDANQPEGKGVLFVAVRGQGTTMASLQGDSSQTIHVATEDPRYLYFTESVESRHGNLPLQRAIAQAVGLTNPPLQLDSQVKYGAVARGQAALYLRLPWLHPNYRENIWDHAAGAIVVEEAGGRVTDMYGKPLDFNSGVKLVNNRGIIASNGNLHAAVLAKLREL